MQSARGMQSRTHIERGRQCQSWWCTINQSLSPRETCTHTHTRHQTSHCDTLVSIHTHTHWHSLLARVQSAGKDTDTCPRALALAPAQARAHTHTHTHVQTTKDTYREADITHSVRDDQTAGLVDGQGLERVAEIGQVRDPRQDRWHSTCIQMHAYIQILEG
jgi:hypothetical protein